MRFFMTPFFGHPHGAIYRKEKKRLNSKTDTRQRQEEESGRNGKTKVEDGI